MRETVNGPGDGSDDSHARMQTALDALGPYVGEMFDNGSVSDKISAVGIGLALAVFRPDWDHIAGAVPSDARLTAPNGDLTQPGSQTDTIHSERLGHILTQMQWLQRACPGAEW